MAKKFILIAGILMILGSVAVLFFRSPSLSPTGAQRDGEEDGGAISGELSKLPDTDISAGFPKGDTVEIGTPLGSVRTKNFYLRAVGGDEASVTILKKTEYFISYSTLDSGFWIAITSKDFSVNRALAERDFLETLGVTQSDACRLDVMVSVPYNVDPARAGQRYGLSFCPEGL
jgi:hypothetical protein